MIILIFCKSLFREMYKSPVASMKGCNPPCWSLQANLLTKCAQRFEFDDDIDTHLFILHMYEYIYMYVNIYPYLLRPTIYIIHVLQNIYVCLDF